MLRGAVERVRLERIQAHHAGGDDHTAQPAGPPLPFVCTGAAAGEGDEELESADHGVEVDVEGLEIWRLHEQV